MNFLSFLFRDPIDYKKLYTKEVILLDVRTVEEFSRKSIQGSQHLPLQELGEKYKKLDKNKTYFIYCASGGRSRTAMNFLKKQGFNHVYNTESVEKTKTIIESK